MIYNKGECSETSCHPKKGSCNKSPQGFVGRSCRADSTDSTGSTGGGDKWRRGMGREWRESERKWGEIIFK